MELFITREDVKSWGPCSVGTDAFIERCFGDRETLNFRQLCNIPYLTDEYLLWTVLRPQVIPDNILSDIKEKFLDLIGTTHQHFEDWKDLPVVDLVGKVVRANPSQSKEQSCRVMAEIVKGLYV
jgi:hypothetical protein